MTIGADTAPMKSIHSVSFLIFLIPLIGLPQTDSGSRPPLRINLRRAVELATSTEGNAQMQISREGIRQAQSRLAQAKADLLPAVDAVVGEQNIKRNLAALGMPLNWGGLNIPNGAGPFNVFGARITASQKILDFRSFRKVDLSRAAIQAAQYEQQFTREHVSTRVAKDYLYALRAQAELEAIRADLLLARVNLRQAVDQKSAGTGNGIEVVRGQVDVANQCQRLLVAQSEVRRSLLRLLHQMGASLQTNIELGGRLAFTKIGLEALNHAGQKAHASRVDLQLQSQREENARLSARAISAERLPSMAVLADYGPTAVAFGNVLPTHTYGVTVEIPLLDGGRRGARRAEAESQWRQERARTRDLNDQADLEVRLALEALESAASQVSVADQGLELAKKELAQAQVRYQAGIAPGLEVTEGQTRLERARRNQLDAVFNHNDALINFGAASGTLDQVIEKLDSTQTEPLPAGSPAESGLMNEASCPAASEFAEQNVNVAAPQPGVWPPSVPEPAKESKSEPAESAADRWEPSADRTAVELAVEPRVSAERAYAVQVGAFKDREAADRFRLDVEPRSGNRCLLRWRVIP